MILYCLIRKTVFDSFDESLKNEIVNLSTSFSINNVSCHRLSGFDYYLLGVTKENSTRAVFLPLKMYLPQEVKAIISSGSHLEDTMIPSRDGGGKPIVKMVISSSGYKQKFMCFEFTTSISDSFRSKNRDGADVGGFTYTVNGTSLNSTKSKVAFNPDYSYEIEGGQFYHDKSLIPALGSAYAYAEMAPHIPKEYGGGFEFLDGGLNLKAVNELDFTGRQAEKIINDPVYNSDLFEFEIQHSAGLQQNIYVMLRLFVKA